MTRDAWAVLLILTCLLFCPSRSTGFSWNIFASSPTAETGGERAPTMKLDGAVAEFTIDGINDPRGVKLLENARSRITGPKSCWNEAYRKLFASCGDIMADKEKQSRLAWHLSSCFEEDSGRPPFPSCSEGSKMVHCRKRLRDSEDKVFLEFFLETNTLCHQLQAESFKHSTERLVNDLIRTARSAEEKLDVIGDRSGQIIRESGHVQDTLSSIKTKASQLGETLKNVGVQIHDVLAQSEAIFEQSKEITASQAELKEGQTEMKDKVEAGMARIQESYESLGKGMHKLKEEAVSIRGEIRAVGESLSSKMQDLQSTANDIGSVAGRSLENQMQLLDGQSQAMEGLNNLYSFLATALDESRETVQKLAQLGQRHKEELLKGQEQIREAHDHIIQNSNSILNAQEEFRAKQANTFAALENLTIGLNAVLAESRFIKAFFFYCCVVFLIYMLTSAKQTFRIRGRLYSGLCLVLALEIGLMKIGADDFDNQFWVMSKVCFVRMVFLGVTIVQILHSIYTFRDYEILNHRLLQTLVSKVQALEANARAREDSERSLMDYSWVFDERADEVDSKMDPSCTNSYLAQEEVGENPITTSVRNRYNLRPRT